MNKVYISYSMQFAHLVGQVSPLLETLGYESNYWKMGTKYDSSSLIKSDIAVFIIDDFNWGIDIDSMTRGSKTELELCKKFNIPVYIAYKRKSDDTIGFYKASFTEKNEVHGIAGTALPVFNRLKWGPECDEINYFLEKELCTQEEALSKVKQYNKRRKHK